MPMAIIDFDRLEIPFEGRFDLILARHMVTHALEPARLWQTLAERLNPGGHVYLFLENDDSAMLRDKRKNLFGEQKAFHFQNFDLPTLAGVLRFNGLDPVFIRHPRPGRSEMVCLAQRNDAVRGTRISPDRLEARRELYRRWRDLSVMSLPPDLQPVFAGEVDQIRQRALAAGYAVTDRAGRIVPRKALRLMHAEGYARLNEQAGGR
jgi:SAM-dependent methyltransferase